MVLEYKYNVSVRGIKMKTPFASAGSSHHPPDADPIRNVTEAIEVRAPSDDFRIRPQKRIFPGLQVRAPSDDFQIRPQIESRCGGTLTSIPSA